LCVVLAGAAQESQPARITFDVASVKRTSPDAAGASIVGGGRGQYRAINVPVRVTITNAWNMRDHQVLGAPAWVASDRFDIVAKEPEGTFTDEQRRLMLQALLVDRFKLQARVETRELPIYNLVLLRADGRLGAELKPTPVDCAALRKARAGGAAPADPPKPMPNIEDRVPCSQRGFFGPQGVTLNASGRTLEQIATTLGTYADRPVVDRTGLTGEYDMLLKFRPEAGGPMGGLAPPLSTTGDPLSDLATLGVAVREQLGLRLEPGRGPVQVLVIDSISLPTED
jgi:uncharacterized protein (TIGR03435 family)